MIVELFIRPIYLPTYLDLPMVLFLVLKASPVAFTSCNILQLRRNKQNLLDKKLHLLADPYHSLVV
jgi:hypothetical protein